MSKRKLAERDDFDQSISHDEEFESENEMIGDAEEIVSDNDSEASDEEVASDNDSEASDEENSENDNEDSGSDLEENSENDNEDSGSDLEEDFDIDEEIPLESSDALQKAAKKLGKPTKPGIIYLSSIPPHMTVMSLRHYMGSIGKVSRIFLQQATAPKRKKKRLRLQYTEGWVEFVKKKHAKLAHEMLNNNRVGGKKSSADYDVLWNIKYLPGFKWAHLSLRREKEKEIHRQRMTTEIQQVLKQTDKYAELEEFISKKEEERKSKRKQKAADILIGSIFAN